MNPCKILDEICQRAVFFKVTNKSPRSPLTLNNGASAIEIDLANDIKVSAPSGPKSDKVLA
nr:MAG TPA: hypothetical protein [Caudoviricetes sp.]